MSALTRYIAWPPRAERPGLLPFALPRAAGPAWPAWRKHRAAYRTVLLFAVLAALWSVWEARQLVVGVHHFAGICRTRPMACSIPGAPDDHGPVPPTPGVINILFRKCPTVLRYLPLVVAALIGGPLFAQEMEAGTDRLAWSQSVSRREWVGVKLATATAVTGLGAVLLTVPVTVWWYLSWRGHNSPGLSGYAWRSLTWWNEWDFFAWTGPVGVAHLLLALMIGAATGMLLRRTLPAVALSAGLTETVLLGLEKLRPHLLTPSVHQDAQFASWPRDSWYIGEGLVRADGTLTTHDPCAPPNVKNITTCLRRHHIVGHYSKDLQMNQFVPLQLVETGICLAACAVLAAFCFWYVRRVTAR